MGLIDDVLRGTTRRVSDAIATGRVLTEAGLITPIRPDRALGMALSLARWGTTPAAGYSSQAMRNPNGIAVVDDEEALTFADIDRLSNTVANGLADMGVGQGDSAGLLVRNSRWFIVAMTALSKLGADIVYLNTGFAGPQLSDVLDSHDVRALVLDGEFVGGVTDWCKSHPCVVADPQGDVPKSMTLIADLAGEAVDSEPFPPFRHGRQVILTSGTTGRPKGAARSDAGLSSAVALLEALPLRAGEPTVIAAPMFHAWGLAHLGIAMVLGSSVVVSRKFNPERILALIDEHRATALAAVPVMLHRLLELPEEVRDRYDTSSLRAVAVSGSAVSAELARRFMDAYGDVLYNLYGSTEVAYATLAAPQDMRAAPGTVGRPLRGTVVRIVSDDGREQPVGQTGRIFVGNEMVFEGYTTGEDKERFQGLVATGDVGRFDDEGRLFVEGRDDEMIVSGGENVFPAEVEELLAKHPAVRDVAVVGVPDDEWGQRLVAHVVAANGQPSEDELKHYVRDNLARYKVPRAIKFHDELPRNETGKLLKRALRDESED